MHYEMRRVRTVYPVSFAIAFKCSKNIFLSVQNVYRKPI